MNKHRIGLWQILSAALQHILQAGVHADSHNTRAKPNGASTIAAQTHSDRMLASMDASEVPPPLALPALPPPTVAVGRRLVVAREPRPAELLLAALIWLADALKDVAENGGSGVDKVAVIALNELEAAARPVAKMLVRVLVVIRVDVTVEKLIEKS